MYSITLFTNLRIKYMIFINLMIFELFGGKTKLTQQQKKQCHENCSLFFLSFMGVKYD